MSRKTIITLAAAAPNFSLPTSGATLRDYYTAGLPGQPTPDGLMSASSGSFTLGGIARRIHVAVALARPLGLDAEAKALAGQQATVSYSGQTLTLTDNADIPAGLRGYEQLALDRQILQATFSLEQGAFDPSPNEYQSRALMAYALDNLRRSFASGN